MGEQATNVLNEDAQAKDLKSSMDKVSSFVWGDPLKQSNCAIYSGTALTMMGKRTKKKIADIDALCHSVPEYAVGQMRDRRFKAMCLSVKGETNPIADLDEEIDLVVKTCPYNKGHPEWFPVADCAKSGDIGNDFKGNTAFLKSKIKDDCQAADEDHFERHMVGLKTETDFFPLPMTEGCDGKDLQKKPCVVLKKWKNNLLKLEGIEENEKKLAMEATTDCSEHLVKGGGAGTACADTPGCRKQTAAEFKAYKKLESTKKKYPNAKKVPKQCVPDEDDDTKYSSTSSFKGIDKEYKGACALGHVFKEQYPPVTGPTFQFMGIMDQLLFKRYLRDFAKCLPKRCGCNDKGKKYILEDGTETACKAEQDEDDCVALVELVNEQRTRAKKKGDECPKPTLEVRGYDFGLVWTEDGLLDKLMCKTIRYDRCVEAEIYTDEDWNKKCT